MGGEFLGGKMAFTLLPLLDVDVDVDQGLGDQGAEVGVEEWCGHSMVGSEERRELGLMGAPLHQMSYFGFRQSTFFLSGFSF